MGKTLVTNSFRLNGLRQAIESVSEPASTSYYMFLGRHMPFTGNSLPTPNASVQGTVHDVYQNMICAKRVTSDDVLPMIRNVPWVSGKAFDQYDDTDALLNEKDFFGIVDATTYYHVWKVLDNAGGANSTVYPDVAQISPGDEVYQTSDGYVWKYMYSVTSTSRNKFATTDYFPVVANTTVANSAVDGSIDIIEVEDGGLGYDNYIDGVFTSADIRILGDPTKFAINTSASSLNDFYNGCVIYLTAGTGVGQHRVVVDYVVSGNTKYIEVDETFDTIPGNGTEYEIRPRVVIVGDGYETAAAEARAVVNSVGNTIQSIEVLEGGSGYRVASATIHVDDVVSVANSNQAVLRPILPPPGGHGFDAAAELGSHWMGWSVRFSNTEANTIPATNVVRQFGIIQDPLFDEVTVVTANATGSFISGERIYQISPMQLVGTVSINSTSANVTGTGTQFSSSFVAGDKILVSNGTSFILSTVSTVTNTTVLVLESNGSFSCTSCNVYLPNTKSDAYISGISVGSILLGNVNVVGSFNAGSELVGYDSGAHCFANSISRGGETKSFSTFVAMHKYGITPLSGTLQADEQVYQLNVDNANGYIHSVNSISMYVTQEVGAFVTGVQVTGNTSSGVANVTSHTPPEVVFGSGEIIYIENIDPVTRSNLQSETIKLIVEF